MNKFKGNLDALRKIAKKSKNALTLLESLYNSNADSIRVTNQNQVNFGYRIVADYPDSFFIERISYTNDYIFGYKG